MILAGTRRGICLTVTLLFSPLCIAQTGEPFLAKLSIEWAAVATPLGATALFSLHVDDPKSAAVSLSKIDGIDVLSVSEDAVQILSSVSPTTSGAVEEKFLSSSFVVDFEEIAVLTLLEDFRSQHGSSPTAKEIETYVYDHISTKTYARSFDLASRVAATGEGDCTEHAVLLTALARAQGMYARVVFGTLVIEMDAELLAYRHAWTEIYDGKEWQIMDATLPRADPALQNVRYLPDSVLEDEGPGYAFSLFGILDSMPSRITEVSNPG